MRWPTWTDNFRHCFGCCEGPRNQHYDAWLARERLNQVKRLEIKLADLSRENANLSSQLGQAVSVLDSYHSFDIDAMGIPSVPEQDDKSEHSSHQRAPNRLDSLRSQPVRPNSMDLRLGAHGRNPTREESLAAARRQSLGMGAQGRGAGRGSSIIQRPMQMPTGVLAHSVPASPQPMPFRLRQMGMGRRTNSGPAPQVAPAQQPAPPPAPPPVPTTSLADIPSSAELDALLSRSAPQRRTQPPQPNRDPSQNSSNVSPVSSLSCLAGPHRTGSKSSAADEAISDLHSRQSFSFERQPSTSLAPADAPELGAGTLPGVMTGSNTRPVTQQAPVPVADTPRLATQARGQVYTGRYSPETSPFAQAAARMPGPGGRAST